VGWWLCVVYIVGMQEVCPAPLCRIVRQAALPPGIEPAALPVGVADDEAGRSEPNYTFDCFRRMNPQAEACRRKALEYERAAEFAADAPVRRMYLDLARQWHDWAEQAERQSAA